MIRLAHFLREAIANLAMNVPAIRKWRVKSGRTVLEGVLSDQVHLILSQFDFFIEAIGWDRVRGKTVIEIGPGDAIPHAFLFLAAGAKRYLAIDRFLGNASGPLAMDLYDGLIKSAPERIKGGWNAMGLAALNSLGPRSILQGAQVEIAAQSIEELNIRQFALGDVIISFNVIEHLSNVSRAFANMAQLLNPDGLMIHRVDYGPHDLWRTYQNPLTFLTASNTLWSLMGSHRGYANRKRHSQVLSALGKAGFQSAARITGRFSMEKVKAIRPFLCEEFRDLTDEDLQIADAEIVSGLVVPPSLGGHVFGHNPVR